MFIYQNNKLYAENGDKLVGVDVYSDNVLTVENTEIDLKGQYEILYPFEVYARFEIPYIFPRENVEGKKEITNGTVGQTKRSGRKSAAK